MERRKLRILTLVVSLIFLSGCATLRYPSSMFAPSGIYHIVGSGQTLYRISKTYAVEISEIIRLNHIKDPNLIGVGERLFIPGARIPLPVEPYKALKLESIERLVGRKQYKLKWQYITLHHSATLEGNAEAFDRYHRKKRMGGLAYHFVIGNGTDSQDGEVEVGWRWIRQLQCDRRGDIQICLVGDFNRQQVSTAQFNSLVKLIRLLHEQYNIPLNNIRRHRDIKGKITECPGKNFPFYKLLSELRKITP